MPPNPDCGMLAIFTGPDEAAWMLSGDCAMLADLQLRVEEMAAARGSDTAQGRYYFQLDSRERIYEKVGEMPIEHLLVWYRCWVKHKIVAHEGNNSVKKSVLWKSLSAAVLMRNHARHLMVLPKPTRTVHTT